MFSDPLNPAVLFVLLLAAATVGWYIAARALADALGRMDLGILAAGGVPGLAASFWAAGTGRAEAGLSLALGAAVAGTTLVLGLVMNVRPGKGGRTFSTVGNGDRRTLAFLLPSALILLLAGFVGRLGLFEALLLLVAGGVTAWLSLSGLHDEPPTAGPADADERSRTVRRRLPRARWAAGFQVALAVVLSVAAAGFAFASAESAGRQFGREVDAIFAGGLFASFMILPLIGIGTTAAAEGQSLAVHRGLVLLAVAMITVAVPGVILIEVGRSIVLGWSGVEGLMALWHDPPGVPMSLRLWRVDATVLSLVGLFLLPLAAGRFRMATLEGVCLVLLYVIYLVLSVAMSQ